MITCYEVKDHRCNLQKLSGRNPHLRNKVNLTQAKPQYKQQVYHKFNSEIL